MRVYLDNNATTAIDPCVQDTFLQALDQVWANPSSAHRFGQEAKGLLEQSRKKIADFFSVRPSEIFFTSSGTEAINCVLRGIFGFRPQGHIITTDVEHAAVYNTVQAIERAGATATYLSVGTWGAATPEAIVQAIQPDTKLIVLMAVNNETGVRTDIETIAAIAQDKKIPFIVDAVALLGKEPLFIPEGVSAICFSGHKIHAPKGVGLAVIRKGLKLEPYLTGGGQEEGMRSGTENVPVIAAFAKALEIVQGGGEAIPEKIASLRLSFEGMLKKALPNIEINGQGPRICTTSNIAFPGIDGEVLLRYLDLHGVAASLGSACMSGAQQLSRVLLNMGIPRKKAASSIRFSFGRFNTDEDVEYTVKVIASHCLQSRL